MSNYIQQLTDLARLCDADERELIDSMILSAGDYVQAVVRHVQARTNIAGLRNEDYKAAVSELDSSRTRFHNGLIDSVNIVNRICEAHAVAPIYTGSQLRREYGDFAIELVGEVFAAR